MLFRTAVFVAALASLSLTVGCTGHPCGLRISEDQLLPSHGSERRWNRGQGFLVKTTCAWRQPCPGPENFPQQEVTRLPVSTDVHTVSHTSVSVEAFIGTLGPLCYGSGLEHHSEIVLYRPGYDLVVIQPWEWRKTIDWKPAYGIAAQDEPWTIWFPQPRSLHPNGERTCSWPMSMNDWRECWRMARNCEKSSDFSYAVAACCNRLHVSPFLALSRMPISVRVPLPPLPAGRTYWRLPVA